MNRRISIILIVIALAVIAACSTTRTLRDGEYLLRSNAIKVNDKSFNPSELSSYLTQRPNSWILGTSPQLVVYNWGGEGKTGIGRLFHKLGVPPVIYDPNQVDESIENILNHLRYLGYYGSQVENQIRVRHRKVYVTYYVALGRRYTISAVDYDIPSYGTFRQDFDADAAHIGIKPGMFLSEKSLEAEAERSSAWFRTQGYYGFNKSYYLFEADTLSADGQARLKMSIRDYALGDTPSSAQEHRKYTIGDVTISRPERLKIRPKVLSNLNILRPGELYNEQRINTTYTRLSSVGMLTGVSVNTMPTEDGKVNCNISLRNSGLQGFKVNLEASVNSTALIGISPQLTYYHRNLFHGGEQLNLSVMGNFQFRPRTDVRSTEFSATASIRFPQFIGLPNRIFSGPYIPKTDISLAFNYQDRPEFRRAVISTAFTYNGRLGPRLFYQLSPIRANMTRLFGIADEFEDLLLNSYMLASAYLDNFDLGISGMLYYTTNTSVVPTVPFYFVRLSLDQSGNFLSLFDRFMPINDYGERTIWNAPYARYIRGELQLGRTFRFGNQDKQSLAMRLLVGAGYAYGNSEYMGLPYDKMFYAGGAMSMRGWQARTLGPGNDTRLAQVFVIPSQVGDMKLEANLEYRFPLFWKLEGALFVDAGNIWGLTENESDEARFSFSNLGESIGLDWGLGIRLNLTFLLLRVDGGLRVHDPGRAAGDRWLGPDRWFQGNYAIHFGVGYPF